MSRGRAPAARWRRGQPHHECDDHDFDQDGDDALPQEDRVREADDAAGHDPAPGHDLANLRLQGAGRGHLQRRRSAQPLRPDASDAEEARGRERAVVHARDAAGHFAGEHRAEHQAESPVEPRAHERKGRHHRHGGLGRLGPGRRLRG